MSATASTPPSEGTVIDGRYALQAMLGEGTFGSVWRAIDTVLAARPVAIKFLKTEFMEHKGAVARFDAEADALAQMSHPNVVGVLDRGTWKQQRFIVMELVEGRSLSAWINDHVERGARPDVPTALGIFDQLCAGLEAAHAVRTPGPIVHRDLKPDNVLMRTLPGGEIAVKVLDFGIAQLGSRKSTQTGALMGTPLYMAPEQAMGQVASIGPWTDVFALGVLLIEMLTTNAQATADEPWWGTALQRQGEVRGLLDKRRKDVPAALWDVAAKCLRSQGSERYGDAGALRAALRQAAMRAYGVSTPSQLPWTVVPSIAPPAPGGVARPATAVLSPHDWLKSPSPAAKVKAREVASDADSVPWLKLAGAMVVGAVVLSGVVVAALVTMDSHRGAGAGDASTRTAHAAQTRAQPPQRASVPQALARNPELTTFLDRWERTRRAEPGAEPMARLYATSLKYHGTSRTPDFESMARDIARVMSQGGSFSVDRARSDWSEEDERAEVVPSACRQVPGATGAVVKVRAWAVEVRGDRNADVGCPRLEGRYLLRLRSTPAGLRLCHETWSVEDGICASCPTAPLCQRRRD